MVGNLQFNPKIAPHPKRWLMMPAILGFSLLGLSHSELALSQSPKPASVQPAVTTEAKPGSRTSPKPFLNVGSQGKEVTELQAMLQLLGYYNGTVTGDYDQPTSTAVAKFQTAAGLPVDGIVGVETWNRLLPPSPLVAPVSATPTPVTKGATEAFPLPAGTKPNSPAANSTTPAKNPPTPATAAQSSQDSVTLPILRLGMKGPAVTGLQERLRSLGFLKGVADGAFGQETQTAVKAAQRKFSLEPDGVVGQSTWLDLMR